MESNDTQGPLLQPSPNGPRKESPGEMKPGLVPPHPPPENVAAPPNDTAIIVMEPAPLVTIPAANTFDVNPRCVFCSESDDTVVQSSGVYLHVNCALWCPEVYGDPLTQELRNVQLALDWSRDISSSCRKPFASIGCVEETCQRSYHYPCAVAVGAQLQVTRFEMRCPVHKRETSSGKRRRR